MAKHKAPSQVLIASTEEETVLRETLKRYGFPLLALSLVVAAVVLYRQWSTENSMAKVIAGWEELGRDVELDGSGLFSQGITDVSILAMEGIAKTQAGSATGGWAKALEIGQHLRDDNKEAAERALQELKSGWPNHILNKQALFGDAEDPSAQAKLLATLLEERGTALENWKRVNRSIFEPLPMPADAPKVRFNTSAGSFVIGLRSAEAPEHCANFIRLCSEGFYDDMIFHEIEQNKFISSGSVASRDANSPDAWGTDDNGGSLKPELGRHWNYQFAVGASKSMLDPSESSDCRFYIVSGKDGHERDRDFSVFGMVVENTDVVVKIDQGAVLGTTPVEPVTILSTEVL